MENETLAPAEAAIFVVDSAIAVPPAEPWTEEEQRQQNEALASFAPSEQNEGFVAQCLQEIPEIPDWLPANLDSPYAKEFLDCFINTDLSWRNIFESLRNPSSIRRLQETAARMAKLEMLRDRWVEVHQPPSLIPPQPPQAPDRSEHYI